MIPHHALSLSFEGIGLLERTPTGWVRQAEVALDADDLEVALRDMRAQLNGAGIVRLVIPNEQIRYLEVADPGDDEALRSATARQALDGATPYAVDDLSIDWQVAGGRMFVAAVARETLAEAEGFAQGHGFVAAAHTACPPKGHFPTEVMFGAPSEWTGGPPARDPVGHIILDTAPVEQAAPPGPAPEVAATAADKPDASANAELSGPKASPPAETEAAAPTAEPETPEPQDIFTQAVPEADLVTEEHIATEGLSPGAAHPTEDDPLPELSEGTESLDTAGSAQQTSAKASLPPIVTDVAADTDARHIAPEPAVSPPDAPTPDVSAEPTAQPQQPAPVAAPPASEMPPAIPPRIDVADETPTPDTAGSVSAPRFDNDALHVPQPGEVTVITGFTSIRATRDEPAAARTADAPKLGAATAPATPRQDRAARITPLAQSPEKAAAAAGVTAPAVQTPAESDAASRRKGGFFSRRSTPQGTAPSPKPEKPKAAKRATPKVAKHAAMAAPDAKSGAKPSVKDAAARVSTPEDERSRMTVFGARDAAVGGKPRFLGLMLTAALLLFLAGVAAWASVFLDNGLARFFDADRPRAVAELPPVDAAPVTDEGEAEVQIAALDSAVPADHIAPAPLSQLERPSALTPEQAAATYAATGIWQRAPAPPLEPPQTQIDDLYVASIDPKVEQFDAVALPAPLAALSDPAIAAPRPPIGPGIVFDLDARGLVRATPEGAVNPDGVRIFAGLPPVVPPLRPKNARLPDAPDAAPDPAQDALRQVRPSLRPGNLIERNERATLTGISRSELSDMRPRLRPQTTKQVAEEDVTATDRAVGTSRTPIPRPRNFASIVQSARTAPPEPQTTQVAAIAPRTVSPRIPSSANVSREATVRNAINLRKVNLIGVYGKTTARRALVRMPNGRYEKVKVGDRIDGGRVTAIGEAELRYSKGGRNVVLKMPQG